MSRKVFKNRLAASALALTSATAIALGAAASASAQDGSYVDSAHNPAYFAPQWVHDFYDFMLNPKDPLGSLADPTGPITPIASIHYAIWSTLYQVNSMIPGSYMCSMANTGPCIVQPQ